MDTDSQNPAFHQDLENHMSEKARKNDLEGQIPYGSPSEQVQEVKPDPDAFPDGGFQAWLCIAGGFCSIFSSFGWINCMIAKILSRKWPRILLTRRKGIGIFQDYYQANQLSSYSPSTVAWISATESFMLFFFVCLF
jgi:hypothetical protein